MANICNSFRFRNKVYPLSCHAKRKSKAVNGHARPRSNDSPRKDANQPYSMSELDKRVQFIRQVCPIDWTDVSSLLDSRVQLIIYR